MLGGKQSLGMSLASGTEPSCLWRETPQQGLCCSGCHGSAYGCFRACATVPAFHMLLSSTAGPCIVGSRPMDASRQARQCSGQDYGQGLT